MSPIRYLLQVTFLVAGFALLWPDTASALTTINFDDYNAPRIVSTEYNASGLYVAGERPALSSQQVPACNYETLAVSSPNVLQPQPNAYSPMSLQFSEDGSSRVTTYVSFDLIGYTAQGISIDFIDNAGLVHTVRYANPYGSGRPPSSCSSGQYSLVQQVTVSAPRAGSIQNIAKIQFRPDSTSGSATTIGYAIDNLVFGDRVVPTPPPGPFQLEGQAVCEGTSPAYSLSWSESVNAANYWVEKELNIAGIQFFASYAFLPAAARSYTDRLVVGESTRYRVQSMNAFGVRVTETVTLTARTDCAGGGGGDNLGASIAPATTSLQRDASQVFTASLTNVPTDFQVKKLSFDDLQNVPAAYSESAVQVKDQYVSSHGVRFSSRVVKTTGQMDTASPADHVVAQKFGQCTTGNAISSYPFLRQPDAVSASPIRMSFDAPVANASVRIYAASVPVYLRAFDTSGKELGSRKASGGCTTASFFGTGQIASIEVFMKASEYQIGNGFAIDELSLGREVALPVSYQWLLADTTIGTVVSNQGSPEKATVRVGANAALRAYADVVGLTVVSGGSTASDTATITVVSGGGNDPGPGGGDPPGSGTQRATILGDIFAGGNLANISVDANAVVSAKGTIENVNSQNLVQDYTRDTVEETADLVNQIVAERAVQLSATSGGQVQLNGTFNLNPKSRGNPADTANNTANPEGGVWYVRGDLVLGDVQFTGRGTIVVDGNVRFEGASGVRYSDQNALLGVIARGGSGASGDITVSGVPLVVGAYYAPNGRITIGEGVTVPQGLFVGDSIALGARDIDITYDGRITTNPPLGFSANFTPSISEVTP